MLDAYTIELKASAQKELYELPRHAQKKIVDALQHLRVNPFSEILPIRKMHGRKSEDRYRLRVGDYRVVYEVRKSGVVIYVVRVGHRKDVYR